ncbi:MAG: Tat pathway signal protein [Ignavibacteria bacterium]|jgi:hypothetical protein|nr:Tat pathway signal protein [Ignavibacteria bacterium]MCU7504558.1 Tat pathway signal protein [Ignavibacteria bacterium]MCU7516604.1 Tat pathway signal protein [Ignavibacteria bacterium]
MKDFRVFSLTIFLLLTLPKCLAAQEYPYRGSIHYNFTPEENQFLDTLERRTFDYFWQECNPSNGLVKDRSVETSPASIAATGFGIVVWAIGAGNNWISRQEAEERTLSLLRFLFASEQSESPDATGYKGFYYHFLNMQTGKREWNCELSTIDTAWLLAGVRFARQFYSGKNKAEEEIRTLSDKITSRVDWDWSVLKQGKYSGFIAQGWRPEKGFLDLGWFGYNESLFLFIVASGSTLSNPIPVYNNWLSTYAWINPYPELSHFLFPPLFGHQYSHMFIDFRNVADMKLKEKGIDYFENSRRAVLCQRKYASENPFKRKGYDSLCWGMTASDGPSHNGYIGYAARGTSGKGFEHDDDGTIAPTAAAASIPFAPEICMKTIKNMYEKYGQLGLWGRYGFVDAFNPDANWVDSDYLGIDQGPIIIMIENLRTGLVWKEMMKDEVVLAGLKRLQFQAYYQ